MIDYQCTTVLDNTELYDIGHFIKADAAIFLHLTAKISGDRNDAQNNIVCKCKP